MAGRCQILSETENRRPTRHIVAVRDNPKQRTCISCGGVSFVGILSIHRAEGDKVVGSMADISVRVAGAFFLC